MIHIAKELKLEHVHWIGTSMGGLLGMMLAATPVEVTGIKYVTPVITTPNQLQQHLYRFETLILNDVGPFVTKASLERIASYVGTAVWLPDFAAAEAHIRSVYPGISPVVRSLILNLTTVNRR